MSVSCESRRRLWVLSVLLVILLAVVRSCSGENEDESRALRGQMEDGVVSERSHKVRAKWKGEQYWASVTSNLTQLEHQKAIEASAGMPRERTSLSLNMKKSSTSKAKKGQSKSKKGSSHHRHRPRSASKSSITSTTTPPPLETKTKTTLVPEHKSTVSSTVRNTSEGPISSNVTTATTISSAEEESEGQISPAETKSPTSTSGVGPPKPTVEPLDRSTLVADLGPYQDFYLEYESDEEDDPPPTPTKTKTTTEMPFPTTEPPNNSSQLKITFFPKTPVNLLYLLQAYASNMKPIELQSPIAGGPAITIPPSNPLRVPVTVNPPNSPFLFNLDLDNFFTRMAISFFYSSIAIAPMIYLLLNSIGSLAGLSIVPFSGGRRKRRNVPEEIFENKDIESLLDQVMHLFDFFMHEEPKEYKEKTVDKSNDVVSKASPESQEESQHSPLFSTLGFSQNFFEIPTKTAGVN